MFAQEAIIMMLLSGALESEKVETKINKTLEVMRELLITGVPEKGIPSYNPLLLDDIYLDMDGMEIEDSTGFIELNDIVIFGITQWDLMDLKINPSVIGGAGVSVVATLNFPEFHITTKYATDVDIGGEIVWGQGDVKLEMKNFLIALDMEASVKQGFEIKRFELLPHLDYFKVAITGFLNDEERSRLISQMLNDVDVNWVNEIFEDISVVLSELFTEPYIYESQINKTLECIRELLRTGVPEEDIPSFNPLQLDDIYLDVDAMEIEGLTGFIELYDIIIFGITRWDLMDLKINPSVIGGIGASVVATLNFPEFHITTKHATDVDIDGVRVWGQGNVKLEMKNLHIALDMQASVSQGLKIKRFELLPHLLDYFKVAFTGLLNDEEQSRLISQMLNNVAVDLVNEKSEGISVVLSELIIGYLNDDTVYEVSTYDTILEICPFKFFP